MRSSKRPPNARREASPAAWRDEYERLRFTVLAAQREGDRRLTEALKPLGLTTSQAEVIRVLDGRPPMTLRELGEHLICERGSPSRLVKSLIDAKIALARADDADARAIRLSLSASGQRLAQQVRTVEEAFHLAMSRSLSPTEAKRMSDRLEGFLAGSEAAAALQKRSGTVVK